MIQAKISRLKENLIEIKERISNACQRASRSSEEVTLVAVTKSVGVDVINQLIQLGLRDIGENRLQDAIQKKHELLEIASFSLVERPDNEVLRPPPRITWHMVGHLQTNKVRKALQLFDYIHSLDSIKLAQVLDSEAQKLARTIPVFIQVNVSKEPSKFGILPEELEPFYFKVAELAHIKVIGLMTITPLVDIAEKVRPYFSRLRELLEKLRRNISEEKKKELVHLSMGMSQDFEVAVEEGATFVRIGSALFKDICQN